MPEQSAATDDTNSRNREASVPSSPESQADTTAGAGAKAPKDRQCPFCGQPFTSSSLGRHLDLYIKPKNPKPPDGVHNVEEIKKIRGNITRRQPRSSTKGAQIATKEEQAAIHEDSAPPSASKPFAPPPPAVPRPESNGVDRSQANSPAAAKQNGSAHKFFNSASWRATGVINDLPPRDPTPVQSNHDIPATSASDQTRRMQDMRRDPVGARIERPTYESESMAKLREQAEIGRAAELALREVLSSLEAARRKVEPPQLFEDVEFYSLTFPGLCLAILPAPPTLFSGTPFPSLESWSLSPPGQKQYENVLRFVNERCKKKQEMGIELFPDSVAFRHIAHLQGAYEHWNTMGDQARTSAWMLELCRAFARSGIHATRLHKELDAANHRVRQLEAEYDRLSRCQLPREYLSHPPNTTPASAPVMRELKNQPPTTASEANYDIEVLLDRWRTTARAISRPFVQPHAHSSIYTASGSLAPVNGDGAASESIQDSYLINGSVWGVNGAMARNTDVSGNVHDQGSYEMLDTPGFVDEEATHSGGPSRDETRAGNHELAVARMAKPRTYSPSQHNDLNMNGKRPAAVALGGRIFDEPSAKRGYSPVGRQASA